MAYLRNEDENLEIDYPLEKIWATIPEVALWYPKDRLEYRPENFHYRLQWR